MVTLEFNKESVSRRTTHQLYQKFKGRLTENCGMTLLLAPRSLLEFLIVSVEGMEVNI